MENWLPVVGYEGLYEVSDLGRVRSLRRSGRVLVGDTNIQDGYPLVRLSGSSGGVKKHPAVHRLVLTAFSGPRPAGMLCRHLNGNPRDNRLINLRWGTPAENSADMVRHGRTNSRITHCPQGHEYTVETTYFFGGRRYCKDCNRLQTKMSQRRRRALQRRPYMGGIQPDIGQPVHYQTLGSADGSFKSTCCAAIVTSAPATGRGRPPKKVDLFVMTTSGNHHQTCLQDEDAKVGGTWHYPCTISDEAAARAAKGAKVKAVEAVAEAA